MPTAQATPGPCTTTAACSNSSTMQAHQHHPTPRTAAAHLAATAATAAACSRQPVVGAAVLPRTRRRATLAAAGTGRGLTHPAASRCLINKQVTRSSVQPHAVATAARASLNMLQVLDSRTRTLLTCTRWCPRHCWLRPVCALIKPPLLPLPGWCRCARHLPH